MLASGQVTGYRSPTKLARFVWKALALLGVPDDVATTATTYAMLRIGGDS